MITTLFEIYFFMIYIIFLSVFIIRKRWDYLLNLVSASIFGVTLEFMSIKIFDNYHYSTNFIIQFGKYPNNVPVVIGTSWGIIIISSIFITDHFELNNKYRPFMDTLLAIGLDFSMDVVAIRIEGGFWVWGVPLENKMSGISYFGVMWGNYVGWYFVVLIYSYVIRYDRYNWKNIINRKRMIYAVISPFFAYIPLYIGLEFVRRTYIFFVIKTGIFSPLYIVFVVFTLITIALIITLYNLNNNNFTIKSDRSYKLLLATLCFLSFHVFYLGIFITIGLFAKIIIAGIISVILFIIDLFIHYFTLKI